MKMKAPQVTRESLIGLKTLIRFDFAREVRKVVEAASSCPAAETTLKILGLSERMAEADLPLDLTMAMIEMAGRVGGAQAWLPMNDDKFAMYQRIINQDVSVADFNGLPPDLAEKATEAIKKIQSLIKKDFDEASLVDPQEMQRGPSARAPMGGIPPPSGLMN